MKKKMGPVAKTGCCQVFPHAVAVFLSLVWCGRGQSFRSRCWMQYMPCDTQRLSKALSVTNISALVFPQSRNQINTCCLHEPVVPLRPIQLVLHTSNARVNWIWWSWEVWQYVLSWFMQNSMIVLLQFFAFILYYSLLQAFCWWPQWAIRISCSLH